MNSCLFCKKLLTKKVNKYCSNQCQSDYLYVSYIKNWKAGTTNGSRGIVTMNISEHIKKYLVQKYKNRCSICNWSKRNTFSNKIPLEVDHIDGNSDNNIESNLRLICPNCHSLTSNFRNLNKGSGRDWRRLKYIKT